jgi:hypothetical protein
MQWGYLCYPHHDYAMARGNPGASDHTSDATADRYTNNSPSASDTLPGGTSMRSIG